jgi:hypothetical protein
MGIGIGRMNREALRRSGTGIQHQVDPKNREGGEKARR